MRQSLACVAALLFAASAWATDNPLASKETFFKPKAGSRLPKELEFTNSTGDKVRMADFGKDRPFILVLAYYKCPRLCTLVLNDLIKGLRGIPFNTGREFDVVVVSFDPTETPELAAAKKAAYMEEYGRPGTEDGWHFLTGDQPNINRLMDATGFKAVWDERKQEYAHARGIMIISPKLLLTRYFLGGWYPPRDLRMALVESSEGLVGSPMDRILLMCFNYDPIEGQYSVAVLNLVRVGGVLTILLFAGLWLVTIWRRPEPTPAPASEGESNHE